MEYFRAAIMEATIEAIADLLKREASRDTIVQAINTAIDIISVLKDHKEADI